MTRNVRIVPDYPDLTSAPSPGEYDILILPGGGPGAKTFSSSPPVLDLIDRYRKGGKWIAAICAGTTALVAAEQAHAHGKSRVTSHPSVVEEVRGAGWDYSEERVVVDGRVVTSRG
jgi:protein DJ-1